MKGKRIKQINNLVIRYIEAYQFVRLLDRIDQPRKR